MLVLCAVSHFLVDALCITAVTASGGGLSAVLLYNTLAFSLQAAAGLLTDRLRHERLFAALAMLLTAAGFFLPGAAQILCMGLGNSLFHVAAGSETIRRSGGKAWQLGVFVAPGAFGVTLGSCFPRFGIPLAVMLALCAAGMLLCRDAPETGLRPAKKIPLTAVLLLTGAVAVRAVGGAAVSFPWKTGTGAAFLLTGFVFAGKALGGALCDRLGAEKTALLSVPAAALLTAFLPQSAVPSLLGQMLLNLTMPVTLWLLCRAMPDSPGFAFGLAASALWPGAIAGGLFRLTGPALWACVIVSFCFGIFAILYAVRILKKEERSVPI